MRSGSRLVVFVALFLAVSQGAFAAKDWTGVPSTGAIDGSSLGFFSFAGATLTYLPGSTSLLPVIARYNVTNTYPLNSNPDMPGWTQLQLGYSAAGLPANAVSATLFKVTPCSGAQVVVCTANSAANLVNMCTECTFPSNTFDFANFLYYVEVTLTRSASTLHPSANSLRIF